MKTVLRKELKLIIFSDDKSVYYFLDYLISCSVYKMVNKCWRPERSSADRHRGKKPENIHV